MQPEGSITRWISQLKAGDGDAAEALRETYFRRMVDLAQHRLQHAPRQAADERSPWHRRRPAWRSARRCAGFRRARRLRRRRDP